jgi:hypothetical protein
MADTSASPPASLIGDGLRAIERLAGLHDRVVKLADLLHGPAPRNGSGVSEKSPSASVRLNLDRAHTLLGDIEAELSRIEGLL